MTMTRILLSLLLLVLMMYASAREYDVLVSVGDIFGNPFGNLLATLAKGEQPVSLSDGGRKFDSNVPFKSKISVSQDVTRLKSVLLQWKVVNMTQMMTVSNVTFSNADTSSSITFCSNSPISLLYLSQDFEYDAC